MKNFLLLSLFSLFLISCSLEEDNYPCPNGNCQAQFTIDIQQNPNSYLDSRGYWHLKHSGLNYFRIIGQTDPIYDEYLINGTPSISTSYDSNYFYIPQLVTWTYPVYSYLGLFSNNNLNSPIPIGSQTYTLPQLINDTSVSNIVGYEINKHFDFNHPAASTMLQTYSKYTYKPTQHMVFLPEMIGDTVNVYIKVNWAKDWWGVNVDKFYELKIILKD